MAINRRAALIAVLLAAAAGAARADQVDSFVYTGFGETYSWTLPANMQVPDANAFLLYPVAVVMSSMPPGFTSIPFDMHFERDFPNFVMGCGVTTPYWDHCYFIIRIDSTVNAQGQPLWDGNGTEIHWNLGSFGDGQLVVSRNDPVGTPEPEAQFLLLPSLLLLASGLCLKRGSVPRRVAEPY